MVTHFFTLQALCRELHSLLRDATISEVFSQQRNEMMISLTPVHGEQGAPSTIHVSVEPTMNYLVLRDQAVRARRNSVDLFPDCVGQRIEAIDMHESDRSVMMKLENGVTLVFQLYDSAVSNAILVDKDHRIREAFKQNKKLAGTQFATIPLRYDNDLCSEEWSFLRRMKETVSGSVGETFKKLFPHFGTLYMREMFWRSDIHEDASVNTLDDGSIRRLYKSVCSILEEKDRPVPAVYWDGEEIKVFSVISLHHLSSLRQETFKFVNDGVRLVLGYRFRDRSVSSERQALLDSVRTEYDRAHRANEKMSTANPVHPEQYEQIGNLLLAYIHEIKKGMRHIMLQDLFDVTKEVSVELDPTLAPSQNAERYFEKAKKAKRSAEEFIKRSREITRRIETLKTIEHDLLLCETTDDLKKFNQTYRQELKSMNLLKEESQQVLPPFRIFSVTGGFEVWVGKSSANNDLLTMKYAKPNDLWFHVRGASGSHTVLKVGGGSNGPPKNAIYQAAAIAAYYSKMRKAGNIPVAYCERKYVRKPKKANEGVVVMEREKVIFVKPGLP